MKVISSRSHGAEIGESLNQVPKKPESLTAQVPQWSSERNHKLVGACRFLIFRFRLDSWWFGVPLLLRGPLLSLPVVLATDYPPVQILMIAMLLTSFLVLRPRETEGPTRRQTERVSGVEGWGPKKTVKQK